MLSCFFFKKNLFNFFQSGLYIDFIIKKTAELIIKNFFIFVGTFFCEKFIIEFLSKKKIDNLTLLINSTFNTNYFFESFFSQVIIVLFYLIFFVEVIFLIL